MKKTLFVFLLTAFVLSSCTLPGLDTLKSLVSSHTKETQAATQTEMQTMLATEAVEITETPIPVEMLPTVEQPENGNPVMLFTIGMHVEPFGETAQGYGGSAKGDYNNEVFFHQHVEYIRTVANIVAAHGGVMTVQVQSPFTEKAIATSDPILKDLAGMGFEIALHFHEDAHLGKNSASLNVAKWCDAMKEEIRLIKIASGVDQVHYWSGGNLYPRVDQAAACAGLSVNSDWKSPATQSTDSSLQGIHPWRPAGGTDGTDFSLISKNDPNGKIIFVPEGQFDREDINAIKQSEAAGGDEAYLAYMEQSLLNSLNEVDPDRVNVFHFTIHAAEFRGDPSDPFALIDQFLTEVIDPLVASGQVQWATYSQMADAYRQWEQTHPGIDPRK